MMTANLDMMTKGASRAENKRAAFTQGFRAGMNPENSWYVRTLRDAAKALLRDRKGRRQTRLVRDAKQALLLRLDGNRRFNG
jgi:hypothetical protein